MKCRDCEREVYKPGWTRCYWCAERVLYVRLDRYVQPPAVPSLRVGGTAGRWTAPVKD